jgi:hypothetical protein
MTPYPYYNQLTMPKQTTRQTNPVKICLIQGNDTAGVSHFYVLDLANQKLTPLKIAEIDDLQQAGFCRISDTCYFICGGTLRNSSSPSKKAYLYDLQSKSLMYLPEMAEAKSTTYPVYENDCIYVVGVLPSPECDKMYITSCEVFSMKTKKWSKLPNIDGSIKGITRIFKSGKKLVAILYRCQIAELNLETSTWSPQRSFVYDFDQFFVTATYRCILTNGYHSSVCEYDYPSDEIQLINTFANIGDCNHVFYLPELDAMVFIDHWRFSNFAIYNNQTNQIDKFDEEHCKNLFSNLSFIKGAENLALPESHPSDGFVVVDHGVFDNKGYIFGNWHFPFKLTIDFEEGKEDASFSRIPQSLFLKIEQGVEILDESRLIFAGGYADDRSIESTNDVMIYDLDTNQLKTCSKLKSENLAVLLKKFDPQMFAPKNLKTGLFSKLFGSSSPSVKLSDDGIFDILLVNYKDEFELWNSESQDWTLLPQSGMDFLPNILDEKDKIVLFQTVNSYQGMRLIFTQYYPHTKSFSEAYNQLSGLIISKNYCLKLSANKYLVVLSNEHFEYFSSMELTWTAGKITKVEFKQLAILDDDMTRGDCLKTVRSSNLLFVFLLNQKFDLKYRCFDLEKLDFVESEKKKKLTQKIDEAFERIGMTPFKWCINSFNVI